MTRRARPWHRIAGGAALLLLLAAASCARQEQPRTIGSMLARGDTAAAGLRAYVLVSADDCESNLFFASYFAPSPDSTRVHLARLLLTDEPERLPELRRLIERKGTALPLDTAGAALLTSVRTLGMYRTPFLVIIDEDETVRYSGPSPWTVDGYVALGRLLPFLVAGGKRDMGRPQVRP